LAGIGTVGDQADETDETPCRKCNGEMRVEIAIGESSRVLSPSKAQIEMSLGRFSSGNEALASMFR
jgi:hypothetical protein